MPREPNIPRYCQLPVLGGDTGGAVGLGVWDGGSVIEGAGVKAGVLLGRGVSVGTSAGTVGDGVSVADDVASPRTRSPLFRTINFRLIDINFPFSSYPSTLMKCSPGGSDLAGLHVQIPSFPTVIFAVCGAELTVIRSCFPGIAIPRKRGLGSVVVSPSRVGK